MSQPKPMQSTKASPVGAGTGSGATAGSVASTVNSGPNVVQTSATTTTTTATTKPTQTTTPTTATGGGGWTLPKMTISRPKPPPTDTTAATSATPAATKNASLSSTTPTTAGNSSAVTPTTTANAAGSATTQSKPIGSLMNRPIGSSATQPIRMTMNSLSHPNTTTSGILSSLKPPSLSSTPIQTLQPSPRMLTAIGTPPISKLNSNPLHTPPSMNLASTLTSPTKLVSLHFTLRLVFHPKSFSSEDIIFNPKSVPGLKVGDMVEIFQPQDTTTTTNTASAPATTNGTNPQTTNSNRGSVMQPVNTIKNNSSQSTSATSTPLDPHNALFIKVHTLDPVKANFDISLSTTLADLFGLQARKDVIVRTIVDEKLATLDFIEISFKNQYIGRSDNWRIKHYLQQQSVFSGQPIQVEGMKLRVDEILLGGRPAKSGLITSQTRFTFRSRSARLFFLIQLSEEMWDFADDGELYFEKVCGFLKILFTEWQKLKVTHAVSIIFFSRTYLEVDEEWLRRKHRHGTHKTSTNPSNEPSDIEAADEDDSTEDEDEHINNDLQFPSATHHHGSATPPEPHAVQTDPNTGRLYQDHYMVVIDCEVHDSRNWENLIKELKRKFNKYHLQVRWGVTDKVTGLRGMPSTASEGNFLEAINAAVSVYDKHYLDRDLYKTGQNIVLFSAGIGLFVVDAKLARLTKQRMVDGGIGCDLICMTRPPLHSVPLFSFKGGTVRDAESSSAVNTPSSTSSFQKEQNKLARAHSAGFTLHPRRGSASSGSSSHLMSSFNNLQSSIVQEGHEEAEEKQNDKSIELTADSTSPPTTNAGSADSTQPAGTLSHSQPSTPPRSSPDSNGTTQPSNLILPAPIDLGTRPTPSANTTPTSSSHSPPVSTVRSLSSPMSAVISPPHLPSAITIPTNISAGGPADSFRSPVAHVDTPSVLTSSHSQRRLAAVGSEKDLTKNDKSDPAQPQYSVPHWLSIYFYDYQDLYDTPFGSLKTSHRDDQSRNRNEEFVSLSSCKLFDFFDLSFFNTGQQPKSVDEKARETNDLPTLVPYFPSKDKEVSPPVKSHLFDAYDATIFGPATQPIGLIPQESWLPKPRTPSISKSPSTATLVPSSPQTTTVVVKPSPSQLQLSNSSANLTSDHLLSKKKSLGKKSKSAASGDSTVLTESNSLPSSASTVTLSSHHTPHSTTSGPNVALQQHMNQLGKHSTAATTAFQTRWGHLFGHLYATLDHLHNPLRPNWKSLCQPAILPLTTDYWPAQSELRTNYFDYNHTLALVQNQNDYNNNTSALLEELICQRQAQDYQHIVSDEIPLPKPGSSQVTLYFSLRNQVHQITYDRRMNTIDVRRHVHKRVVQDAKQLLKFPYSYFLWSPHTNSFLPVERDIEPNRDEMKWSDADNLLCDRSSADLTEDMKYRRNHYAIIPTGITPGKYRSDYALDTHSKRFGSQAEALLKQYQADWQKESEKRIQAMKQFFTFMFAEKGDKIVQAYSTATTALATHHTTTRVSLNNQSAGSSSAANLKEKQDKALATEQALTQAFNSFGIKIDSSDQLPFPLPPVKSADELKPTTEQLAYVNQLIQSKNKISIHSHLDQAKSDQSSWGCMCCSQPLTFTSHEVYSSHILQSNSSFIAHAGLFCVYCQPRVTEQGDHQIEAYRTNGALLDHHKQFHPELLSALLEVKSEEERKRVQEQAEYLDTYEHALGFATADVRKREIKIPLTKPAGVGEDSKRYEWFQLQYDTNYNPHGVFHMEIRWLVATGMHLENWIKNFIKKAETRFGLQIVKIPTNQPLKTGDSFHVPIPLPVPNPYILRLLEEYLLRDCNFVLDSELEFDCRQYVHDTGMCAIRRLPHGLIWLNNHLPAASHHRKASIKLFTKIKRHAHRLLHMRALVDTILNDVYDFVDMKLIVHHKK